MKTIKIFQENAPTIELYDDDSGDILEYSMRLSELLKSTDIEIIKTTSGCAILKPSEIKSMLVNNQKSKVKKPIKKSDNKMVKEKEKDFIGEEDNNV